MINASQGKVEPEWFSSRVYLPWVDFYLIISPFVAGKFNYQSVAGKLALYPPSFMEDQ